MISEWVGTVALTRFRIGQICMAICSCIAQCTPMAVKFGDEYTISSKFGLVQRQKGMGTRAQKISIFGQSVM